MSLSAILPNNPVGSPGPEGPAGPAGANGAAGPAGPPGGAVASAQEVEVTVTTGQTVLTYTPTVSGPFQIGGYFRVVTAATTVGITVTYTDAAGAQTATLLASGSKAVGSYPLDPLVIDAIAGDAISVVVTAATIDQVYASAAIWGSASGAAIASYDTTVLTKLSLAPVAYWKLDEAAGATTAADSSGNGYTLTVHGTVTFGEPSVVPTDSETSAQSDGSTGYLSGGPFALVPTGASPFTLLFCVKWSGSAAEQFVAQWGGGAGPGAFFDSKAFYADNDVGSGTAATAALPAAGLPHLFGCVWDGSNMGVFFDGKLAGGAGATVNAASAAFYLFGNGGASLLSNFPIGRVAIFAGILTPKDWELLTQAFTGV